VPCAYEKVSFLCKIHQAKYCTISLYINKVILFVFIFVLVLSSYRLVMVTAYDV
jgi:hypothetical protein